MQMPPVQKNLLRTPDGIPAQSPKAIRHVWVLRKMPAALINNGNCISKFSGL